MAHCSECGAPLGSGETCVDLFNRMLALEWTVMGEIGKGIAPAEFQSSAPGREGLRAHFFAVGTYQLQHPDRLEVQAVLGLWHSLEDMLAGKVTRDDVLRRARQDFDGPARVRRRKAGRDPMLGPWPDAWPVTVADICNLAPADYMPGVRRWAEVVSAAIRRLRPAG